MKNEMKDVNKLRYLHERNKQISLFAAGKLVRDLTKIELFRPRFNVMYLGCLALIKQSKMLNQVCVNSLKMKTNQYKCVTFDEWVSQDQPKNIIKVLEEDNSTLSKYWEHLFEVINNLIKSNDVNFDMAVLKELSAGGGDFNKMFTY